MFATPAAPAGSKRPTFGALMLGAVLGLAASAARADEPAQAPAAPAPAPAHSNSEAPMNIEERVTHGFAQSGDVKIHYATVGEGPLVVMIHGFPDYWYTWRDQMALLADNYKVVAIDQRGYNESDKPEGVDNYDMKLLVEDVVAVIKSLGRDKATIVGHDWGGMVSWSFAMTHPEMIDKLVIMDLPHPNGLMREMKNNPDQQKNAQYARNFQAEGAEKKIMPAMLAFWEKDPEAKKKLIAALTKSDMKAMLNYYKKNYPREPYDTAPTPDLPKVTVPVLMFHGLEDTALLPGALNDTWQWVEKDLTIVTIPGAGHWVHRDATELVNHTLKCWLER